jgi:hypothetical protein
MCVGAAGFVAGEYTRLGRECWPSRGATSGRSVVVAAATDGVSCPSRYGKYHADNEEDDPDDQAKMGEGERGDEAGEEESEDDEDDSESDHDMYLVSAGM